MAIPPSSSPNRMGVLGGDVAGFPNGRRVGDDVLDIVLQAAAGATPLTPAFSRSPNNTLGDGVERNDVPYLTSFPYLGIPHAGNDKVRRCTSGARYIARASECIKCLFRAAVVVAAAFVVAATLRDARQDQPRRSAPVAAVGSMPGPRARN